MAGGAKGCDCRQPRRGNSLHGRLAAFPGCKVFSQGESADTLPLWRHPARHPAPRQAGCGRFRIRQARRCVGRVCQQAHELAVGGFVPRVELQQALGGSGGGFELARGCGMVDELLEGRNRQGAQALAFQQRPLLKGRAAVEIEAPKEVTR